MKRKMIGVIALTLCALMTVLCLAACGNSDTDKSDSNTSAEEKSALIGTWASIDAEGTAYIFNEDGTGKINAGDDAVLNFTYVDKGSSVEITYEDTSTTDTWEYTIDGTLTMKDALTGTTLIYTKQ